MLRVSGLWYTWFCIRWNCKVTGLSRLQSNVGRTFSHWVFLLFNRFELHSRNLETVHKLELNGLRKHDLLYIRVISCHGCLIILRAVYLTYLLLYHRYLHGLCFSFWHYLTFFELLWHVFESCFSLKGKTLPELIKRHIHQINCFLCKLFLHTLSHFPLVEQTLPQLLSRKICSYQIFPRNLRSWIGWVSNLFILYCFTGRFPMGMNSMSLVGC